MVYNGYRRIPEWGTVLRAHDFDFRPSQTSSFINTKDVKYAKMNMGMKHVQMYIYTYRFMCTHMYIYKICIYTYTYIYTYIYTNTHICLYAHIRTSIYTCGNMYIHIHVYRNRCEYICVYVHIYIHTHGFIVRPVGSAQEPSGDSPLLLAAAQGAAEAAARPDGMGSREHSWKISGPQSWALFNELCATLVSRGLLCWDSSTWNYDSTYEPQSRFG